MKNILQALRLTVATSSVGTGAAIRVPSGVTEVARLQARKGFVCLRD